MTFIINPHRFGGGGGGVSWNTYVAALSPWAWLKLDDAATGTVAADASGNGRNGAYPNGANAALPDRLEAALVNGSTNGIICGGGGNTELWGVGYWAALTGSFTLGAVMATTSTTAKQQLWTWGSVVFSVAFNHNYVTNAAQSGTISFWFDTTGANANALAATGTGWNDGNNHLILIEYDSVADTQSIWVDGVEVATRARAGTKPVPTNQTWTFLLTNPYNGMAMDEVLVFNKVLTPTEHSDLASYVL